MVLIEQALVISVPCTFLLLVMSVPCTFFTLVISVPCAFLSVSLLYLHICTKNQLKIHLCTKPVYSISVQVSEGSGKGQRRSIFLYLIPHQDWRPTRWSSQGLRSHLFISEEAKLIVYLREPGGVFRQVYRQGVTHLKPDKGSSAKDEKKQRQECKAESSALIVAAAALPRWGQSTQILPPIGSSSPFSRSYRGHRHASQHHPGHQRERDHQEQGIVQQKWMYLLYELFHFKLCVLLLHTSSSFSSPSWV